MFVKCKYHNRTTTGRITWQKARTTIQYLVNR